MYIPYAHSLTKIHYLGSGPILRVQTLHPSSEPISRHVSGLRIISRVRILHPGLYIMFGTYIGYQYHLVFFLLKFYLNYTLLYGVQCTADIVRRMQRTYTVRTIRRTLYGVLCTLYNLTYSQQEYTIILHIVYSRQQNTKKNPTETYNVDHTCSTAYVTY